MENKKMPKTSLKINAKWTEPLPWPL